MYSSCYIAATVMIYSSLFGATNTAKHYTLYNCICDKTSAVLQFALLNNPTLTLVFVTVQQKISKNDEFSVFMNFTAALKLIPQNLIVVYVYAMI